MFYTYVLLCDKKGCAHEFYIGYTKDLKKRLDMHKNKFVKTTKKFDNVSLIYYEACRDDNDARRRELQLKTGFGRGYIKKRLASYLNIAGMV